MQRDTTRLSKTNFDILVIGAGINGAAIAYQASMAGAKVVLLEKDDFASGTSSKSTKLLHGGIRYLENLEFDLVAESLKERYIQYKNAPHLVDVLTFIIPVYAHSPRPMWMMKLGVWLYDLLSGPYSVGRRQYLTSQQLLAIAPGIKQEGLQGAVCYCDAQMDDARLCLENVLMAQLKGAQVANHAQVVEFLKEDGRCTGVLAKDLLSGESFQVMAKKVIVTAGPWADELLRKDSAKSRSRLRPTKGVHIVYKDKFCDQAFLLQNSSDRRIFFIIPFKGHSLIGTTDTDYQGKADEVSVQQKDIDYLLGQAALFFPKISFEKEKIITSFAGLRPLVYERGSPSNISRKHSIEKTLSGIWYVLGGKYTTYRSIALECVQKVFPAAVSKLIQQKNYPLYGSPTSENFSSTQDMKQIVSRFSVCAQTVSYLNKLYGSRYLEVLNLTLQDPSLRARLCECSLSIRAQVLYSMRHEMAMTPADIYERRLQLQYNHCPSKQCLKAIEEMVSFYAS